MTTIELVLFWTYALVGPVVWGLWGFGMINGRSKMEILKRPSSPLPDPAPKVSIIIPAKDEAQQIEKCVSSVLQQDYPNFELHVVNDRSTDGTGDILDALAAKDSRLRAVHLQEGSLPPGWGGKSWALHNGLKQSTGEWLLFVDADVQLEPDVLSATIAQATKRGYDLVSLLPRFVSGTFSEGLLQPLAGAATSAMFFISQTNNSGSKTAFANGQYLCVKRSAYDAIGGHEAIRGTLSEDVALARQLKSAGYKVRLGWGDGWGTVRMYAGFDAVIRGWSRNFYVGSLGKPWRILGLMTFLLLAIYSVLPAAGWGLFRHAHPVGAYVDWGWLAMAGLHWFAMTTVAAFMYDWSGEPFWYCLLLPVGCAVIFYICIKSLVICATGKVVWRGTQYTRADLPGQ